MTIKITLKRIAIAILILEQIYILMIMKMNAEYRVAQDMRVEQRLRDLEIAMNRAGIDNSKLFGEIR